MNHIDINNQAVVTEDGIYRSTLLENPDNLFDAVEENFSTTHECFLRGLEISRNKPFLGKRSGPNGAYEWITYQEAYDRAHEIGSGLLQLGVKAGVEEIISIYCKNRIEWTLIDLACAMYTVALAGLYDTISAEASSYVIEQTESKVLICDNVSKMDKLFSTKSSYENLKTIVLVDHPGDDFTNVEKERNIKIVSLEAVQEMGKNNLEELVPPKPENLFCLCYTSGSTGLPKGVITSHRNVTSMVASTEILMQGHNPYNPDTVNFSYLPLPHAFERLNQLLTYTKGGRIGFFQGDVKKLFDDLQELKPTIFTAVPRILNRVYDKIHNELKSPIKMKILEWALRSKQGEVEKGIFRNNSWWDILILKKIQNLFGGNIKFLVIGSAPILAKILNFFRYALGCQVYEGYGQTESTGIVTITLPGECDAGHVGPPAPNNYVKLVDVPEAGYFQADGKGEICVKGMNVTGGYFKLPEKTAEIFDSDGWLHTQDIGMFLPNGTLKIIDRKKNIFKLSQGEYIAPEKIENIYLLCPLISQIFVAGDSLQSYIVAIVVPNDENLLELAKLKGIEGTFEELCDNKEIKSIILTDIQEIGKKHDLKGFEQVKAITLTSVPFGIENGLISSTLKNKRFQLLKTFQQHISDMYKISNGS
ncbi:long-chain-fatty-acid--CoA ligase 5 [Octopus bimaculoides]|uniref:Long-chain-fatty-acid--CoA ligase n=1 Tax=Octopus bimaculoides TaxID=37653 RepID=A0A0L8GGD8_OCTBM|nr:long-chain-fatty-acid--CoA ligase 5 [Octopus bimaculoides]XP_014781247.1 long-chain-fatty-acid--CoA ligase 5 [Octopus bimaculoides]|eukprot:XP_014781245.1 PREDICTED: long-chain-fatty-acid--CoA ligase 5-like [Octopus bimaculoides]